jgi:hypothetical protein
VSQAYPPYIHQITASMSSTRSTPAALESAWSALVSCVIVKTNTRSKNSSKVDTRSVCTTRR